MRKILGRETLRYGELAIDKDISAGMNWDPIATTGVDTAKRVQKDGGRMEWKKVAELSPSDRKDNRAILQDKR